MRLLAVHGIIAPKKPWPVTDGSHVYVRKLKFCNLGAWLGTPGPQGTVGRAGNIWKKTESKTSESIEIHREVIHNSPTEAITPKVKTPLIFKKPSADTAAHFSKKLKLNTRSSQCLKVLPSIFQRSSTEAAAQIL